MTEERALDMVQKLIRVAADSGATEPERANAALRACTLISEHDFSVRPKNDRPERERRGTRMQKQDIAVVVNTVADAVARRHAKVNAPTPYTPALAAYDDLCGEESCREMIYRGERVWRRTKNGAVEYVHADCWHD